MDIQVSHLCKRFGEKTVFQDFSAVFPRGETTCMMGPSGCGKTTLLSLLLGLEQPDEGEITGMEGLRKSAVFQEHRLCEDVSAAANLRLVAPHLSRQEAEALLTGLGLGDSLRQPVGEFSGGMKRRTAILRALIAPYDVLLADEPFQGLDQDTKQLVLDYWQKQTRGKTVILVTHDLAEAEALGDHILSL